MGKEKESIKTKIDNEITAPVSLQENIEEKEKKNILINENKSFYVFDQKGSNKMINAVNPINQTVQPLANVIFTGNNVRTNSCNNCCGWLTHNNNSGIFTLTKPGIYKVHFNANVSPTVAGAITLNITNAGENISGGEMKSPGTTIDVFDNVSAEVLVRVPCNSSVVITIKNNTPTNPITVSQPSLTITREC